MCVWIREKGGQPQYGLLKILILLKIIKNKWKNGIRARENSFPFLLPFYLHNTVFLDSNCYMTNLSDILAVTKVIKR